MCTVSIIGMTQPGSRGRAVGSGFRLVTNRDELRTRPLATAPRWHDAGMCVVPRDDANATALFPVDPAGGGTWIGASPGGVVLCLLNANPVPAPVLPSRNELISRGVIIPTLLSSADDHGLEAVMGGIGNLDLDRFAPFRLVGVAPRQLGADGWSFSVIETRWDRTSLVSERHGSGPVCFVSSALGDPLVKPRLALFDAMVRSDVAAGASLAQDRFHRHRWPASPEISVLMVRPDARTVSVTTVEVSVPLSVQDASPLVSMRYEPVPEVSEAPISVKSPVPSLSLRRSPD